MGRRGAGIGKEQDYGLTLGGRGSSAYLRNLTAAVDYVLRLLGGGSGSRRLVEGLQNLDRLAQDQHGTA